jgi:BirA family transcriptional regulator, biotin operon repressor / biotin---[acetyl-CoA-carboxylase] ligase
MTTPFDLTRFHALLRTQNFGRNLIFESSVGSTMDVAREAALHGAAEGTVSCADEQTAGRGRLGRSWVTPPAVNLASTLVLRPPASLLREIAMMAPLAVCHAVQDVAGLRPGIKWPNDVLVGTKKLAGVLIESDVTDAQGPYALVGAGINVNFDPRRYEEIRDIATSIKAETGSDGDREALLAAYLLHFEEIYAAAKAGESPFGRWRERLVTLGQGVHAVWDGGTADGIAEDVGEDGALIVRTADGRAITLEAADVTLRA